MGKNYNPFHTKINEKTYTQHYVEKVSRARDQQLNQLHCKFTFRSCHSTEENRLYNIILL
jgi:hypothetical protein